MKTRKVLLSALGIIIILIALWKLDFIGNFYKVKDVIRWDFIIFCAIMINLIIVVRAMRWKFLMHILGVKDITLWDAIKIVGPCYMVASITPSWLGEVSKVFMTKYKKRCIAALGIEYLGDFIAILVVPLAFLAIYLKSIKALIIIIIFTLIVILGIFYFYHLRNRFMDKILRFLLPKQEKLISHVKEVKEHFSKYLKNKEAILVSVLLSMASYFIVYVIGYLVFISLGLDIGVFTVITGLSVAQVVGIITFIPLGLGTRELSALGFFTLQGFDYGLVINGLIIIRLLTFIPIIVGYLLYMLNIKKQ